MDLRGAIVVEDSGRIRKTPQLGFAGARGARTEPGGLCRPLLFRVHPAPPFLSGHVTVPSMRRPVLSIPCANKAGDSQGGAALLWGEQPSSAAWGDPSRPGFPQRGNGKGGPISLLPQADCCPFVFESFAQSMIIFCVTPSLPTAKTPCFHSHSWSCLLRCLLVSSFFNRVLPSQNRTEASRFRDVRSRYSSQSPEPGDLLQKH